MEKDPVCGMTVDPKNVTLSTHYKGKTFHFCSKMCKAMFEREPEKYAKAEEENETV